MKYMTIALLAMLCAAPLAGAQGDDEWVDLFDGESLEGWLSLGGTAPFTVEDGVIVGRTVPGREVDGERVSGTGNTFLCTERHYGNFILELEFQVDPGMNSGVQIRSNSFEWYRNGRVHGYQVEIDPSSRAWSGGIYDEARRGWLFNLEGMEEAQQAFKQNEWNHFRIEARGENIKTWLNGVPVADLDDFMTQRGFIGLQVHATKSEELMEIRWRNIRIIDLDRAHTEPAPFAAQRTDGATLR